MYQSDEAVESLLTVAFAKEGNDIQIKVEALDGIEEYFNTIPESTYTKESKQELNIPVIVEVIKDGELVYELKTRDFVVNDETASATMIIDVGENIDTSNGYIVQVKAAVFDRVVELASIEGL